MLSVARFKLPGEQPCSDAWAFLGNFEANINGHTTSIKNFLTVLCVLPFFLPLGQCQYVVVTSVLTFR